MVQTLETLEINRMVDKFIRVGLNVEEFQNLFYIQISVTRKILIWSLQHCNQSKQCSLLMNFYLKTVSWFHLVCIKTGFDY